MIKRVVSFALHQPLFIVLMVILFIGGGVAAFDNLPIEAFPDVSDIQVNVITLYPGRAPEEVEKQVTIPIETALNGMPHAVRHVFAHAVRAVLHRASRLTTTPPTCRPASRRSNAWPPWMCRPGVQPQLAAALDGHRRNLPLSG